MYRHALANRPIKFFLLAVTNDYRMRTPTIDAALQQALSAPRLGRYLRDSGGIIDAALSLYERNARMAEAFYRPLQSLEVCLRNGLSDQLAAQYGANWFTNSGPPFADDALKKLDRAIDDIQDARRNVTPGAVVAELSFGFWVTILAKRYDGTIWRSALASSFLEAGRRMPRQRVHNRMDAIRKFRNRVFHHEPIYDLNPAQVHAEIIEAIAWICPASAAWAWEHSRVPYVLANPWPP